MAAGLAAVVGGVIFVYCDTGDVAATSEYGRSTQSPLNTSMYQTATRCADGVKAPVLLPMTICAFRTLVTSTQRVRNARGAGRWAFTNIAGVDIPPPPVLNHSAKEWTTEEHFRETQSSIWMAGTPVRTSTRPGY